MLFAVLAAGSPAVTAKEPGPGEGAATPLQQTIDRLAVLAPEFGSTGLAAITVIRLDTQDSAAFQGADLMKAASVTKAVWVAAALRYAGVDRVSGIAVSALFRSSNESAGLALDIAGGIDRVNRYAHDLGLAETTVYEWGFGRDRRSRLYPGPLRGLNTTTTDDLASFWFMVERHLALQGDERAALLEWTRGPKEELEGQRLIRRLPEEVGAISSFKMGWLPVGRTYELEDDETGWGGEPGGETIVLTGGAVDVGAGIVRVPGGPAFVIAIGAYDGRSWQAMTSWVEYGSCVVYSVIAEDPVDCVRSYDPGRIATRVAVPSGGVTAVVERHGFLTVSGWAMDPDAWWRPTLVGITVDGATVGTFAAIPTGVDDLFAPRFRRTLPYELAPGPHEVCVIARNDGAGSDASLGCVEITA